MVIAKLEGGLSNQIDQYVVGKYIAYKLNTEFKLDLTGLINVDYFPQCSANYRLSVFNIKGNFATPEEIAHVKANGIIPTSFPNVDELQGDVFIEGNWMHSRPYLSALIKMFSHELTLRNPLSPNAVEWKKKILAAECSVAIHFRHGDYAYDPQWKGVTWAAILPLDYYYTCINILKQRYKNLTAFVFSDNIRWVKQNLLLGVPTEYVSGSNGVTDDEEFILMSLCKHNIVPASTFSGNAARLNSNPDKKIFHPLPANAEIVHQYLQLLETKKISPLDSGQWINVPFDFYNQPEITLRPYFSLLLVVNDDTANLVESLNSITGQDYKFFELIIIDNASTDDSGKICRQVAKTFDNVTLIKLHSRVQNGAAWNIALKAAQGYYVMFLKGNDCLLANALTALYSMNTYISADVVNSFAYLREDKRGDIDISDRKFFINKMSAFQNLNGIFREKLDKTTLLRILSSDKTFFPLCTRIFKRKFLEENKIHFKENVGDDAENLFVIDALFQTEKIIFASHPIYIAPNN